MDDPDASDMPSASYIRWNIFARELERILAARGLRLGHLDNRQDELGRPLVHPEKVRRLQSSLTRPKQLAILNPDELERVIRVLALQPEEETQLRAALLATAVERLLMDRIAPHTALLAADEVLYVLLGALTTQPIPAAMSTVRDSTKGMLLMPVADTDDDDTFEQALDVIDRATLSLHMALGSTTPPYERIERAAEARAGFERALVLLRQLEATRGDSEDWTYWRDDAQQGQKQAMERLLAIQQDIDASR